MSSTFAGPHHCIGTVRQAGDAVFAELRAACVASGGTLTLGQIDELKAVHDARAALRFSQLARTYNKCMDAVSQEKRLIPFDQDMLASMFLYAYTSRFARVVFQRTARRVDAWWLQRFYGAFVRSVVRTVAPDFPARTNALYVEAGVRSGQDLAVWDLVRSPDGEAAVRDCLDRLSAGPVAPEALAGCCSMLNQQAAGVAEPARISYAELDRFVSLLRYARPRRPVVAADPPPADLVQIAFV